jgi:ketosteroid isomerase-like protein
VTDERVAMLRQGLDAWNRGDLDGILNLLDPDVSIHLSGAFPDLSIDYRGHEGFRKFWRAMNDMWSPLEMEAGEIEPIGELLMSGVTFRGTGREGIQVERVFYFLWEIDEESGEAAAYSSHRDRESALEAAEDARVKGGLPT